MNKETLEKLKKATPSLRLNVRTINEISKRSTTISANSDVHENCKDKTKRNSLLIF